MPQEPCQLGKDTSVRGSAPGNETQGEGARKTARETREGQGVYTLVQSARADEDMARQLSVEEYVHRRHGGAFGHARLSSVVARRDVVLLT